MTGPDGTFADRIDAVEAEDGWLDEDDVQDDRWPVLDKEALHGLAGQVVAAIDPYTEADPAAVLFAFLAQSGCFFGNAPHLRAGHTNHPGRIWPILTGSTATGAKGTAVAAAAEVMYHVEPHFMQHNRVSGLSSSEGLIKVVRDASGSPDDEKHYDPGVDDKRLLVNEPEFASVLGRARREGNTLSATLREAWDGSALQTLVSHNPLRATNHHISVVAAITPTELLARLSATDVANGLANRFVIVCCRRSKLLPDGGDVPLPVLAELASRFRIAVSATSRVTRMKRTPDATKLWSTWYRRSQGEIQGEGPVAAMLARAAPHCLRLSVVYALLDGATEVAEVHLQAAIAAWDYAAASASYIFTAEESDPDLGRLVEYVNEAPFGRTRSDISVGLFQRHKTRAELDQLCAKLLALGTYERRKLPPEVSESGQPGGRPRYVYLRCRRKAAAE